jgi:putative ABC transport system permease protein
MVALEMMSRRLGQSIVRRIYAVGLALGSRKLRTHYRDEMRETFGDRAAAASGRGFAALAMLVCRELADLVRCRFRRRPAGPGLMLTRSDRVTAVLHDVRYAVRTLYRQPAFTAVALLTLALGIGATTSVFTVVNGVLLRPLPYGDPDRLVILLNGRSGRLGASFSPPNFRDATEKSGVFDDAAAISPTSLNLTGNGDPQRLEGADVTWTFFSVLGATPQFGRPFVETDTAIGTRVVVISDGLWRRLGARPAFVGTDLRLDGESYTVIGVAQPELTLPGGADYWRPLVFTPHQLDESQRGANWVNVVARLKTGTSLAQANAAVTTVAEQLQVSAPRNFGNRRFALVRLRDRIVRDIRPALLVLFVAVGLVLLIACVNVANLLLARACGRVREVAVRAAVGAGRLRLVQQFVAESLVLGGAGALAGLLVAFWSTRALVAVGPPSVPRLADVGMDGRVLAFTIGVAAVTSIVFGLVPAFATAGISTARTISGAGRGTVGHSGTRLRKTLVVAEMALAVVLLVGAGLLIRSYQHLSGVDPGFSPDHVLTFRVALPDSKYKTEPAISEFVATYTERLARNGVTAAAVLGLPLDDDFSASSSFTRPGEVDRDDSPSVGMRVASPDYFRTMNIPLRRGRMFDRHDTDTSPEVVIINEEAARRYWPNQDPIGQQLHLGARLTSTTTRSGMKTIVGIVGDVKYGGLDLTAPPEVFLPYPQHPVESFSMVIRTPGDPMAFVGTARAELAGIDRELPLSAIRPMAEVVGRSIAERKFTMMLLGTFAAVAVVLAAIGVYGVLAYVVSQRTQEIGVRLAIGATPADVVALFVREGVALAAIGLAVGGIGALASGRALTGLLFGVRATDPLTFVLVATALAVAAFCASYVPARRAARVDPMLALRAD